MENVNREIKFRGFNENKCWVFGHLAFFNDEPHIQINKVDFVQVNPDSVGQYTGLKDHTVSEQEIYYGDVLRFKEKGENVDVFKREGAPYVLFKEDDEPTLLTSKLIGANWVRKLGNIYENPELLETENNSKAQ